MGDQTVFTSGVKIRKGQNTKGTDQTVSNGSIIHVYDNQMMLLVDGGKVVDYTACLLYTSYQVYVWFWRGRHLE